MNTKFIHVVIIEGFNTAIERMLNVDHVIQFEPNMARGGTCHVYLSDGKVVCVSNTFEQLIEKFKN
jgi:L-2-hydroxyglutarate oxidase LhgO